MTRDSLVSVAAMFDANLKPVALCWSVDDREEKFAHAQSSDSENSSLPDELHSDLADESLQMGMVGLLATMLWAPDEIRTDQGQPIHMTPFLLGRFNSITGWNVATRTLVAKADDLLFMTRRIDQDLAFPMSTSIEEMHQQMEQETKSGALRTLIVLQGGVAGDVEKCRQENGIIFRWTNRA